MEKKIRVVESLGKTYFSLRFNYDKDFLEFIKRIPTATWVAIKSETHFNNSVAMHFLSKIKESYAYMEFPLIESVANNYDQIMQETKALPIIGNNFYTKGFYVWDTTIKEILNLDFEKTIFAEGFNIPELKKNLLKMSLGKTSFIESNDLLLLNYHLYMNPKSTRTEKIKEIASYKKLVIAVFSTGKLLQRPHKDFMNFFEIIKHPVMDKPFWYEKTFCDPRATKYTKRDISGLSELKLFKEMMNGNKLIDYLKKRANNEN